MQQTGHRAYIEATRLRAGLRLESSPRDYLLQRVERKTVRNRLEVPRHGMDYVTALDPATGDRRRLKGELYGIGFQRERFDRTARRLETERREIEELTANELKRLGENSRRVARRAAFHRARYGGDGREHAQVAGQGVAPAGDRRHGALTTSSCREGEEAA